MLKKKLIMAIAPTLILATDLDGTFLEGDSETLQIFYKKLKSSRSNLFLIYATGRGVNTVQHLYEMYNLPEADIILADHGTQIVDGYHFQMIEDLQKPIVEKWNNGHAKIHQILQSELGITQQPYTAPYRAPYYYEPNLLRQETLDKITAAGYEVLLSCDAYFDVLPSGINKGTSLVQVLDYYQLDKDKVITCGDSLNDLPLFQTGLKSIMVGNAEDKLITACNSLANVYQSSASGILGIIDGLQYYSQFAHIPI